MRIAEKVENEIYGIILGLCQAIEDGLWCLYSFYMVIKISVNEGKNPIWTLTSIML